VKQGTYAGQVRAYALVRYIGPARLKGEPLVRIVSGEIHRALGLVNRYPLVCDALASQSFLKENRLALEGREGTPSGQGAQVVFTYRLLDLPHSTAVQAAEPPLSSYRGIAQAVFESLGGGEAFIRSQRLDSHGSADSPGDPR